MFDGTSLRLAWFCSARQRRSRGVYRSILTPALIVITVLPLLNTKDRTKSDSCGAPRKRERASQTELSKLSGDQLVRSFGRSLRRATPKGTYRFRTVQRLRRNASSASFVASRTTVCSSRGRLYYSGPCRVFSRIAVYQRIVWLPSGCSDGKCGCADGEFAPSLRATQGVACEMATSGCRQYVRNRKADRLNASRRSRRHRPD